jgi:hypothetical protein
MPNTTVRASARPMPKPKPGSVESIRRQVAADHFALLALAAIKVDLLQLGIGHEGAARC